VNLIHKACDFGVTICNSARPYEGPTLIFYAVAYTLYLKGARGALAESAISESMISNRFFMP